MRILVVEDEYKIADIISSRLKEEKYTVDTSLDGEEGLYNALTDIYESNSFRCNVTKSRWL